MASSRRSQLPATPTGQYFIIPKINWIPDPNKLVPHKVDDPRSISGLGDHLHLSTFQLSAYKTFSTPLAKIASIYKRLSAETCIKSGAEDGSPKAKQKKAQRVLLLSSRGINARHRHLLNDLAALLPHSRRESKFDSKKNLHDLNELADLCNCNNLLILEARKQQDLYMHISKAPNGPRARFHVQNLHTMSKLNFMGNSSKGSRPILSFDAAFNGEPYLRLLRELLTHTFGVPLTARKAKPFIDRVLAFIVADGRIWVRHYQIAEEEDDASKDEKLSIREIGPRFCLTPIYIQEGSFGGPIIYENK